MKTYFRMAGALLAVAALATAATPALAGPVHVELQLGTPYPQPVYVQSEPIYYYVQPEPIYVDQAPVYVYQDQGGWRQQQRWREHQWREQRWREQQWRERQWRERQWHEQQWRGRGDREEHRGRERDHHWEQR